MSSGLPPFAEALRAQGQRHFRRNLAAQDWATTRRLLYSYQSVLRHLDQRLADVQSAAQTTKSTLALAETRQVQALRAEVKRALDDFAKIIQVEARQMEIDGVRQANGIAEVLLRGAGIRSPLAMPGADEIRALAGYVDHAVFQKRLAQYGTKHADHIGNIILNNASLGKGPLATANHIVQYFTNMQGGEAMPLADALRMTRTVQIYSARRGTQAIYLRNADLLDGWIWGSALDQRVCISCVVQHGSAHPLTEILNDHYNGRCAMLPQLRRQPLPLESGLSWFQDQSAATQQKILGQASYAAWRDGALRLEQMSVSDDDDLYGPMRHAPSLRQVLGHAAAAYYTK